MLATPPLPLDVAMAASDRAFYEQLGQRLAERRKARGITQVQLAERLGVAQQTLAHYEGGTVRIAIAKPSLAARPPRPAASAGPPRRFSSSSNRSKPCPKPSSAPSPRCSIRCSLVSSYANAMGLGWSTHRNDGWRGQFNRMLRWHQRVVAAAATGDPALEDYIFAFFQNCYYVQEWIAKTAPEAKPEVNRFFAASPPLRLCRDLCNGTKHLNISRPSVDAKFSIGREYAPAEPTGSRFFVVANGKHDLLELAAACVAEWERFCSTLN
jgi:DNA-binding XRE family transcriptional regulator